MKPSFIQPKKTPWLNRLPIFLHKMLYSAHQTESYVLIQMNKLILKQLIQQHPTYEIELNITNKNNFEVEFSHGQLEFTCADRHFELTFEPQKVLKPGSIQAVLLMDKLSDAEYQHLLTAQSPQPSAFAIHMHFNSKLYAFDKEERAAHHIHMVYPTSLRLNEPSCID